MKSLYESLLDDDNVVLKRTSDPYTLLVAVFKKYLDIRKSRTGIHFDKLSHGELLKRQILILKELERLGFNNVHWFTNDERKSTLNFVTKDYHTLGAVIFDTGNVEFYSVNNLKFDWMKLV